MGFCRHLYASVYNLNLITMVELLTFIGSLNLGTFIVIWTSTIFLVIFISLLLISVSQMNKESIKISKKVKILIEELSEKKVKINSPEKVVKVMRALEETFDSNEKGKEHFSIPHASTNIASEIKNHVINLVEFQLLKYLR